MSINIEELTVEDFQKIKEKMDEAEHSDTPFAVVQDDEVHVFGDADKTEVKKHDYSIEFAFPNTKAWKEALEQDEKSTIFNETSNYIGVRREYKDVFVSPRVQTAVMSSFVSLYRFFNTISEDGEIKDLTPDEVKVALQQMNQAMVEAMCHAVATVLRIDESEEEFMLVTSTTTTLLQLIVDFPEVINGMDFFTDN